MWIRDCCWFFIFKQPSDVCKILLKSSVQSESKHLFCKGFQCHLDSKCIIITNHTQDNHICHTFHQTNNVYTNNLTIAQKKRKPAFRLCAFFLLKGVTSLAAPRRTFSLLDTVTVCTIFIMFKITILHLNQSWWNHFWQVDAFTDFWVSLIWIKGFLNWDYHEATQKTESWCLCLLNYSIADISTFFSGFWRGGDHVRSVFIWPPYLPWPSTHQQVRLAQSS